MMRSASGLLLLGSVVLGSMSLSEPTKAQDGRAFRSGLEDLEVFGCSGGAEPANHRCQLLNREQRAIWECQRKSVGSRDRDRLDDGNVEKRAYPATAPAVVWECAGPYEVWFKRDTKALTAPAQ